MILKKKKDINKFKFSGNNKKLHVFPPTLPSLILCAYPKVLLAIFEQVLLKS